MLGGASKPTYRAVGEIFVLLDIDICTVYVHFSVHDRHATQFLDKRARRRFGGQR
jgi:hypothetical protein